MLLLFFQLLLVALVTVNGVDRKLDERWEKFKTDHNRKYKKDVEEYRRTIWEDKVKQIEQHNIEYEYGKHSYTMKETEWDDLTYEEFMHFHEAFDVNDVHRVKRASRNGTGDCFMEESWKDSSPYNLTSGAPLPKNVDWVKKGYVTSVKNQGRCGSCWAFSAVGSIESQWYKKTKKLNSLSEQFLVDCSKSNNGCGGGLPSRAFADIISFKGISSQAKYPYNGVKGTCKRTTTGIEASIKGYRTLNSYDELLNAVAYVGPVSVGIQTGGLITNLGKGVFTDCSGKINHAVLVVGYGMHNGKKVWKVKNSWGTTWGDKGYFYMIRGESKDCGVTKYASYPTVDGVVRGPLSAGEVASLGEAVSGSNVQQMSLGIAAMSVLLALFSMSANN